jgi:transposase-like protein
VTSDEHKGLKAAIEAILSRSELARCQFPYARNLLGMVVSFEKRKELAAGLRGVFAAPSSEVALRLAEELADRWRASHPKRLTIGKSTSKSVCCV